GGAPVSDGTKLTDLDQISGLTNGDVINLAGFDKSGAAVDVDFTITDAANDTLGDLLTAITTAYGGGGAAGATAKIVNGQLQLEDDAAGYSKTDFLMSYTGAGSFDVPEYFRVLTPGSHGMQNIDVEVFDSQGIGHVLSASFVKTSTPNTWDMVLTSITGGVDSVDDRRISGITFLTDGSYGGMGGTPPDDQSFTMVFSNDPGTARSVSMDFGTIGETNGVTLTGGNTTVSARGQDGYASGQLAALSASREGTLMGLFTNGIRKEIAAIKLATFQNPAGLMALGNNYMAASGNSGDPVPTTGLSGGAGAVRSGSLEESNVEVSGEFVNLIQAQNGFQASARTIRVANEILKELTNLIR
ncbi:MAG: flagellar hook-basal body complex protein, partial [Phycisphaerales bacterium]|nr:flagellar hook-basal body complex protein [Phycisphaerales bacterium]